MLLFDSTALKILWDELTSRERLVDNNKRKEISIPHTMIKLMLQLSINPTKPNKSIDIDDLMKWNNNDDITSEESVSEFIETEDDQEEEDELDYAFVEEERKLWLYDFNVDDSDSDFNESDEDVNQQEDVIQSIDHQHDQYSDTSEAIEVDDNDDVVVRSDPFLQNDGGDLPYGGHISLYSDHIIAGYPLEGCHTPGDILSSTRSDDETSCLYSTTLLKPLPLKWSILSDDKDCDKNVLCLEKDVCVMITEMLLGYCNDFFELSRSGTSQCVEHSKSLHPLFSEGKSFSLTPTARHSRLVNIRSETLKCLLNWFVVVANDVQDVRNYVHVDFGTLRRLHNLVDVDETKYNDSEGIDGRDTEPMTTTTATLKKERKSLIYHPTSFSENLQTSIQQVLHLLLENFENQITSLQNRLLLKKKHLDESNDVEVTVTLIYIQTTLKKLWVRTFRSASFLIKHIIKLDYLDSDCSVDYGDLYQHEQVIALWQQLQQECNTLQLINCHSQLALREKSCSKSSFVTNSKNSDDDDDDYAECTELEMLDVKLELSNLDSETNFIRDCYFSLQESYFTTLLNWLYDSAGGRSGKKGKMKALVSTSDSELLGGFGGLHNTGISKCSI